jgi:hypothetical protein
MEPRLMVCAIFATDASPGTESTEIALQKVAIQPRTKLGNKKRCVATLRMPGLSSLLRILHHHVIQFASQRRWAALEKLRVPNDKDRRL